MVQWDCQFHSEITQCIPPLLDVECSPRSVEGGLNLKVSCLMSNTCSSGNESGNLADDNKFIMERQKYSEVILLLGSIILLKNWILKGSKVKMQMEFHNFVVVRLTKINGDQLLRYMLHNDSLNHISSSWMFNSPHKYCLTSYSAVLSNTYPINKHDKINRKMTSIHSVS